MIGFDGTLAEKWKRFSKRDRRDLVVIGITSFSAGFILGISGDDLAYARETGVMGPLEWAMMVAPIVLFSVAMVFWFILAERQDELFRLIDNHAWKWSGMFALVAFLATYVAERVFGPQPIWPAVLVWMAGYGVGWQMACRRYL